MDVKAGKGDLFNMDTKKKIYTGGWLDDVKHGYGLYQGDKGTYDGNFVKDAMEGKGRMLWNNGESYEGDFVQDLRHG